MIQQVQCELEELNVKRWLNVESDLQILTVLVGFHFSVSEPGFSWAALSSSCCVASVLASLCVIATASLK